MTALLVVVLCVLFLGIELAVRAVNKNLEAARVRREREAVLKAPVKLDIATETPSLQRAEVPNAKARILAVDDEAIVLDSFRKILVLAGFSVDTVNTGPEALALVRQRDYDFLFTDLKMPVMEGTEVVKAVKHLRPDVDVAVITGFATIETAVETMMHGAVDYVQKPFTEEELVAFANRMYVRRQARIESQSKPAVRVVAPELVDIMASREYVVPGGMFVSTGHTWARIEDTGEVCVGIDDFARKAIGKVERVELPAPGTSVKRGEVLFVARRKDEHVRFRSPVSGTVTAVNGDVKKDARAMLESPYEHGWTCMLHPTDLTLDLANLRIGKTVVSWYQDEVTALRKANSEATDGAVRWSALEERFMGAGDAPRETTTEIVEVG